MSCPVACPKLTMQFGVTSQGRSPDGKNWICMYGNDGELTNDAIYECR